MLINMTPHAISIRTTTDEIILIQPSGSTIRIPEREGLIGSIAFEDNILDTIETIVGNPTLPDPQQGVTYIVSMVVAQYAASIGRSDFMAPDTGATAIRIDGKIEYVTRLRRFLVEK